MTKQWNNKNTDALIEAILQLENRSEARRFLRDLLTESEIIEFGNRWLAARMLANRVPYVDIQKKTSLSSTTIARISKWLQKGKGGYRLVLGRLALVQNTVHAHHHVSSVFEKSLP
ncbi:MAG TPA: hypothetical protein DCY48_03495 [Candidatus Magasanikbacteria bacterium]|nr:MAG: hypothetical protein A3I74_04060 [Candidatus Magasanikbacteria bacterium RIFCSPLOWO2_02_FULL_47_16]OGH79335.1 MAG: hypothetical protein A3C10_04600 [Candidatus Magasanikbacteria bacterium RIFCSPHIGHO2_02_FULL_48_18]OGH83444.1 MAG: hypothetical protein A3G08_03415 [Candidatus Magasanikbacteria bacterium RIFCSPLOWO2_12_FULL_47_9b]HAZ28808.1 hypothetical protein [Candidatus Magasanikbacteria bacterium]